MVGVREKKHIQTRTEILRVARELFLEKGYEGTTMEQIAENAVVGTGTLYNYFPSKDDIFLSIMSDELLLNAEGETPDEVDTRMHGAEEALMQYLSRYIRVCKLFRKSLWQDLMSMVFAKSGSHLFKKWFAFDMRFAASLERKLEGIKKKDCLGESFDCAEASLAIYSVMMTLFVLYVYTDSMTMDNYEAKIRKQLHFVLSAKG